MRELLTILHKIRKNLYIKLSNLNKNRPERMLRAVLSGLILTKLETISYTKVPLPVSILLQRNMSLVIILANQGIFFINIYLKNIKCRFYLYLLIFSGIFIFDLTSLKLLMPSNVSNLRIIKFDCLPIQFVKIIFND